MECLRVYFKTRWPESELYYINIELEYVRFKYFNNLLVCFKTVKYQLKPKRYNSNRHCVVYPWWKFDVEN